jgi:hypothetical protein
VIAERFEPVYLVPEGPAKLTEYGKRFLDHRWEALARHKNVLKDIAKLGLSDESRWATLEALLVAEGIPTAISSGTSQYGMQALINHINGVSAYTMPATVAIALATAAPTSTTTGSTLTEAAYTGYTEEVIASSGWNSATAATPSVATNNGAITFPNCTGGTSTLLGFMIKDSNTIGAGNSLWYGTLASTVISTTQTPPTIANTALNVSMTGT